MAHSFVPAGRVTLGSTETDSQVQTLVQGNNASARIVVLKS